MESNLSRETFRVTDANALYNVGDDNRYGEYSDSNDSSPRNSLGVTDKSRLSSPRTSLEPSSARDKFRHAAKRRESVGLSLVQINVTCLGKPVEVEGLGTGILKFVGPHHVSGEIYCGVALDKPAGTSDGKFEVRLPF